MNIRSILLMASLLVTGLVFLSCGQNEGDVSGGSLEVTPTSIVAEPQGGQEYITILSGEDWLIRSDENWVKPEVSSGKGSSDAVKVSLTFSSNSGGEERTATVTVKTLSGSSADVIVSQEAAGDDVAVRGISTADDLMAFAAAVNEATSLSRFMDNGVVVLLNDIDASSIKEWTPIGTAENPFTGVFNGRDFAIRNVSWAIDASSASDAGLFGYAKGATIKNLTVGADGDKMTVSGTCTSADVGGIVGYAEGGEISYCSNKADIVYDGSASGEDVCVAGICGRFMAGTGAKVGNCTNAGDVTCPVVARAAGFVGYSEAEVNGCTNSGCILSNRSGETGPAWGCSYSKNYADFADNTGKGHVGDYDTFKDAPESADADAYLNAVASPATGGYDLERVAVDWEQASYYDWTQITTSDVADGVTYTQYTCDNVPRMVNVLEVDLSNPSVEITTAFADDCIPNPNGNGNANNGYNLRETLSQLCERKRSEGQDIIAGVNSGFFDSNDGITRGFHIEDGHPVYINNPDVVKSLYTNHRFGFTVFADGVASCGAKSFTGKIKVGDSEFEYSSVNDTIMRNVSSKYEVNLYDSHYKEIPHPSTPSLTNRLAKDALYVIAEYTDGPMAVNNGYFTATVVSIHDGRSTALSSPPYVTEDNQIGIRLSGVSASSFASLVSVGTSISLRCDMTIEGETTRPIMTMNSTMYHIMKDGQNNMSTVGSSSSLYSKYDPMTFPVISKDGKKVWIVQIDGRQDWYSTGVKGYEMYRIAEKLGGYNMTRFDGGGSSVMWLYDSAKGKGEVVNSVCDTKGERSCMNYILIRRK